MIRMNSYTITKPDEDWDYGRIATDTFFGSAHGFVDAMTAGKSRFLKAGYKIVLAACWKMANCFHDGVSINDTTSAPESISMMAVFKDEDFCCKIA